jgi:hypothetical protein
VFGEADRADRVEVGLRHVAVVEEADFGEVFEAFSFDGFGGPLRLGGGQGHAQSLYAVLAGGVADHAAPAATHVQETLAGLQVELAGHQVVLLELGFFQRRSLGRENRARVRHRRPEDVLVERVRDVVVVVDRGLVAGAGVAQALEGAAPLGQVFLRWRGRRLQVRPAEAADDAQRLGRRRALEVEMVEHHPHQTVRIAGMDALDLQVALDVGADHAQIAGGGEDVGQAAFGGQVHVDRGVLGAGRAAVVGGEAERQAAGGHRGQGVGDRDLGRHCGHRRVTAFS